MDETELINLTNRVDLVTIGRKSYRLLATIDELVFQKVSDPNASSSKKQAEKDLKIKIKDLLFVRQDEPNNGRSCCCKEHRYSVVGNNHLIKLSLKSELSGAIIDVGEKNEFATIQNPELGLTLGIYHVLRVKNYCWCVALLICKFPSKDDCDKWRLFLSNALTALNRPKRLIVFVNPFGGKGKALKVYKTYAHPILTLCGINIEMIETKRANHARDLVLEKDLREFDGIASVGGDGLFNEVLNGIILRTQKDSRIDVDNQANPLVIPRWKLAAIPAGSTNALAFTVHGTNDPLTAVLHIAVGDSRGVDVCGVYFDSKVRKFACTSVSFGFLGDVLKDSERLRSLGPPRYLVSGVKTVFKHPRYKGKIEMKPKEADSSSGALKECHSLCDFCKFTASKKPKSLRVVTNEVKTLEEEFLHLVGVITPCISGLSPRGLSPMCHLGDGNLHLIVVSRISRLQNFSFMAKVIRGVNPRQLTEQYVKFCEVTEFCYTPSECLEKKIETTEISGVSREELVDNKKDLGTWNVDGEILSQPNGTIYFKVHQQLITMYCRGIEREEYGAPSNNGNSSPSANTRNFCCCGTFAHA